MQNKPYYKTYYWIASRSSACIFGLVLAYIFFNHLLAQAASGVERTDVEVAKASGATDSCASSPINDQEADSPTHSSSHSPSSRPSPPPSQHPNHSQMLRQFIGGVIDYARWPDKPSEVNLCVAANPALLLNLHNTPLESLHGRVAVKTIHSEDSASATQDCSVLFMGQDVPENTAANWVMALVSKPVITIRENPQKCSDGTLVCLYTSSANTPTFDLNLDSVSRSGVLLNPQVMTLSTALMPNSPPP